METSKIGFFAQEINITKLHPSPPPPPPFPPPASPPPNVPPVTMEGVTKLMDDLLCEGCEVTPEAASNAADQLGSMIGATSGGTSGKEVADALVAARYPPPPLAAPPAPPRNLPAVSVLHVVASLAS